MEDVHIDLMKGIGSVGECINVKLKLFSALEEVIIRISQLFSVNHGFIQSFVLRIISQLSYTLVLARVKLWGVK